MLSALTPLLILLGTTLVVLLAIAVRRHHAVTAGLAFAGLAAAFASLCLAAGSAPRPATMLMVADNYSRFFTGLIVATAAGIVVLAYGYLEKHGIQREEFYPLLLMATIGCAVLAASIHFVSFFLGLEILSVALYAMIAYLRDRKGPLEAGIKYLILAAASAAFFLFGIALIYADRGMLEFAGAGRAAPAALVLILIGIGFKLALVPFHLWTPDIYEGAPAPVAAFVATASKTAVFAVLVRFAQMSGARDSGAMLTVLSIIAIASMLAGNLLALLQNNVKRIVAYSSIAHLGYVLVALIAAGNSAAEAVAVYLVAYCATILGIFAVITALSTNAGDAAELDAYRGLFWRRPAIAAVFTAMLLSLAGIPATLGFLGKFYVIAAGAANNAWALIIILVVSSVIGLFYYLRVVVTLYAADRTQERAAAGISPATGVIIGLAAVIVIGLGIYPTPLVRLIRAAVALLEGSRRSQARSPRPAGSATLEKPFSAAELHFKVRQIETRLGSFDVASECPPARLDANKCILLKDKEVMRKTPIPRREGHRSALFWIGSAPEDARPGHPGPHALNSEEEPQAELNVARSADCACDHTRARAPDGLAGKVELRMVQNIEEFASELQMEPLSERELLEH